MSEMRGEATMQVEDPDSVRVKMTLTLPLRDWKRVREHLEGVAFPEWWIRERIDRAIRKISAQVSEEIEATDDD